MKLCPGEEANLNRKSFHNHSFNTVGLFELPRKLPSGRTHWCAIRRYRVLSVDTCSEPATCCDACFTHSPCLKAGCSRSSSPGLWADRLSYLGNMGLPS